MAASTKKPSDRKPATAFPSRASIIKLVFRRKGAGLSLKRFLREEAPNDPELAQMAGEWLHNKRANFSRPELCIGCTRKKKQKGNQGKPEGKKR